MEERDWVLGDMVWTSIGLAVVIGLIVLNSYVQRLARIEEEQRLGLLRSNLLIARDQQLLQSRRPDAI